MPTEARSDSRLTYQDFLRFPDDGLRHEIIDGVHYVTPCPNTRHQLLVGRLYYEIESALRARPGTGQVFLSPFDVIFTEWDVVEPDLLFIAADQADILTSANVQGSPALVIEILSPSTRKRDQGIKRQLFDRAGVREYWMVDPEREVVSVFRREADGGFVEAPALTERAESLTTRLIPGLAIRIGDLFKR
ncbi:MAG: Uma2 family endonuclease, partial [Vicinamibacterales bacterium]